MDEFEQFKETYFAECAELLDDMETRITGLRKDSLNDDSLHAIFRAVHSIKAGAGAFKFDNLVAFSHDFEGLLDGMRNDVVAVDESRIALLLTARDLLADLVDAVVSGHDAVPENLAAVGAEMAAIVKAAHPGETPTGEAPATGDETKDNDTAPGERTLRIDFAPLRELFIHANEPLLLVRELKELGPLKTTVNLSRLPDLSQMDPEEAYLSWVFELTTEAPLGLVEEVFEFVTDDCQLSISDVPVRPTQEPAAVACVPSDGATESRVPRRQPEPSAGAQPSLPSNGPGLAQAKVSSIRVDLDRVDRLVDMVGELLITQSMLAQQTSELAVDRYPDIVRGLEELSFHARELQDSVMAIRMQPVRSVFARIPRLVRDLSKKLDKKVRLVTEGEETEVDKTVIEEIADPITHMIRNAMDHGIESPGERRRAGKTPEATIRLSAEHRGGCIIISIADDGRGVVREIVTRKAVDSGLIGPDASLSDEEIDNLIFRPGFSTAGTVTDVSGRGVGLDVVRRNIERLGGSVHIQSEPGIGAAFIVSLPLTLAVMDGMVIAVDGEHYVLPVNTILETIRPVESDIVTLPSGDAVISLRGNHLSLIHVARMLGLNGGEADPSKGLVVFVDTRERGKVGLVIDEMLGQQQVVIKSLQTNFKNIPGIAAVTILGNGRVAPILDVDGLCRPAGAPGDANDLHRPTGQTSNMGIAT